MLIFAYGSNMNLNRLQKRVPSATKVANVYTTGYILKCNKVSSDNSSKANIVQSYNPEDKVWGVLFEIDENQKAELDRVEGLGNGYNETTLTFFDADNNTHQAQVYIADENFINDNLRPYDWYSQFILTGAEQNQLPQEYINKIQSLEFLVDPDAERRLKSLTIIYGQR